MTSFCVQRGEGVEKGPKIAVILKVCPLKRSDFSDAASDIPHESADVKWDELFTKCPDIGDAILVNSDTETALNCRLVCKAWRVRVNECKPLWSRSGI